MMKKSATFLLLALLLFSCKQKSEMISTTAIKATNNNEKLIQQYFEYFNKHDWQKMAAMYIETAEFRDPSLGQAIVKQTRAQLIKKYTELSQMFPDLHDTVVTVYPSGENTVIVEFVSNGTSSDHSKFELPICTLFTIENGLITKDFTYYDNFE